MVKTLKSHSLQIVATSVLLTSFFLSNAIAAQMQFAPVYMNSKISSSNRVVSTACQEGYYRSFQLGSCGEDGSTGLCKKRPEYCTMEYRPVIACNGKLYSNACHAASFGQSIRSIPKSVASHY